MSCPCAWSWCCFKVSTGDNNNITLQQFQPRHNSPQVPVNNNNNNIILQQPQSVSKTIKNDHNIILFSDPPVPSIIVSPKFVFLIKWHQGKHFFQIFNWWLLYFIGWWGTCWHQHHHPTALPPTNTISQPFWRAAGIRSPIRRAANVIILSTTTTS